MYSVMIWGRSLWPQRERMAMIFTAPKPGHAVLFVNDAFLKLTGTLATVIVPQAQTDCAGCDRLAKPREAYLNQIAGATRDCQVLCLGPVQMQIGWTELPE